MPKLSKPPVWPHFTSPLRSTALTARIGSVVGICFGVCFITGLLSHYQYSPWSWLPEPASPVFLYRITQGTHVATGIATIPLVLVKLWSVYPNLFRWPPARSVTHAIERGSVFLLVASALLQLLTGFLNVLGWYAWPWGFVRVHFLLAFVVIGSILIHIGVKLPDINYGLRARLADGDVLSEIPWSENPDAHSNAGTLPPPSMPALNRRGLLVAAGTGVGVVVATTVGQSLTPLRPIGLLAPRQSGKGPQRLPVNTTAEQAKVVDLATKSDWTLQVAGARPFILSLADIEEMAQYEASLPINCVEGWSAGAHWQGLRLIDVVRQAGGDADSRVRVISMQKQGSFRDSIVHGPQVSKALLATHLNGERLVVDHGYPLRLIAPDRAGVLNTKWLNRIEVT